MAGAFLVREEEGNYVWAMEQLSKLFQKENKELTCFVTDREKALMNEVDQIFPKSQFLLCRRHVRKNIEDFARKSSKDKARGTRMANTYMELFKKHTKMEYDRELSKIKREWNDLTSVHAYVQKNWLGPYKERIVAVWTDKVFNLGQNTTNR